METVWPTVGDRVTIYHDPITRQRPEGEARVVSILAEHDDWIGVMVQFAGDEPDDTYARRIER